MHLFKRNVVVHHCIQPLSPDPDSIFEETVNSAHSFAAEFIFYFRKIFKKKEKRRNKERKY